MQQLNLLLDSESHRQEYLVSILGNREASKKYIKMARIYKASSIFYKTKNNRDLYLLYKRAHTSCFSRALILRSMYYVFSINITSNRGRKTAAQFELF